MRILYGQKKWKIGLDLTYEYVTFMKMDLKVIASQNIDFSKVIYINDPFDVCKAGLSFDYIVWQKKKWELAFSAGFGFYGVIYRYYDPTGKHYQSMFNYRNPYPLYGGVGLRAGYELPKGFTLVLNTTLTASSEQGVNNQYFNRTGATINPSLTIGIRKNFEVNCISKCHKKMKK